MKRIFEIDWKNLNNHNLDNHNLDNHNLNNHNLTNNYIRAGIIPYTIQNNIIFFAFSIDNNIACLGDFGGHYEDIDNDLLDTAIREYTEESLNVFGYLNREFLKDCFVIEGPETIEIFVFVSPPFYQYTERFNNMIVGNKQHEVQNIIWLSRRQLLNLIDNQEISFDGVKIYHMYTRLYDCLKTYRNYL